MDQSEVDQVVVPDLFMLLNDVEESAKKLVDILLVLGRG